MVMHALKRSRPLRTWLTVAACMSLLMSLSAITYFGAIINYLYSYYHSHTSRWGNMDPLWMLTVYQGIAPAGMVFGSSYFGRKWGYFKAVAIFVCVYITAAFAGFFTIQEPVLLLITFGVVQGFSCGCIYNLIWNICMRASEHQGSGLATGIMGVGTPVGALVISELALLVVNPYNVQTDLQVGNSRYFTDRDVLDRVPYLFVMHGSFCCVVHFTGIVLLYLALKAEKEAHSSLHHIAEEVERILSKREDEHFQYGSFDNSDKSAALLDVGPKSSIKESANVILEYDSQDKNKMAIPSCCINDFEKTTLAKNKFEPLPRPLCMHTKNDFQDDVSRTTDLSPKEAVRTSTFWLLWFINVMLNFTIYIYANLYKTFGEMYLHNDALLTNAGVLAQCLMILTRPLYGQLVDSFGVKAGLIFTSASSTVFIIITMAALDTFQPVLYVIAVIGEINSISTLFQLFNYSAKDAFGPSHYSSVVGLLFTSMIPGYLIMPSILPTLVKSLGWMYIFMMAEAFSFAALLLSLFYPKSLVK